MMFGTPNFFEQQLQRFARAGSRSQVHVLLHSTNGDSFRESGAVECLELVKTLDRRLPMKDTLAV
jgi:hypothetical protein